MTFWTGLFQNTLFWKEFLARITCSRLFIKIKKWSGIIFWVHIFCILFPWKRFILNTLSIDQVSIWELLSFSKCQTCIFKFLSSQLMMPWTLRFIFNHLLEQPFNSRKKRGRGKCKSVWYKKHFWYLVKYYHLVKKEKAKASFKKY